MKMTLPILSLIFFGTFAAAKHPQPVEPAEPLVVVTIVDEEIVFDYQFHPATGGGCITIAPANGSCTIPIPKIQAKCVLAQTFQNPISNVQKVMIDHLVQKYGYSEIVLLNYLTIERELAGPAVVDPETDDFRCPDKKQPFSYYGRLPRSKVIGLN